MRSVHIRERVPVIDQEKPVHPEDIFVLETIEENIELVERYVERLGRQADYGRRTCDIVRRVLRGEETFRSIAEEQHISIGRARSLFLRGYNFALNAYYLKISKENEARRE